MQKLFFILFVTCSSPIVGSQGPQLPQDLNAYLQLQRLSTQEQQQSKALKQSFESEGKKEADPDTQEKCKYIEHVEQTKVNKK